MTKEAGLAVRNERKALTHIVRHLMNGYLKGNVEYISDHLPRAPHGALACMELLARFRRHVKLTSIRAGGSGRK